MENTRGLATALRMSAVAVLAPFLSSLGRALWVVSKVTTSTSFAAPLLFSGRAGLALLVGVLAALFSGFGSPLRITREIARTTPLVICHLSPPSWVLPQQHCRETHRSCASSCSEMPRARPREGFA